MVTLQEMLTDARLKQAELARLCGVTREAISQYRHGKRTPDIRIADQLARALGFTLEIQNGEMRFRRAA